MQQHHGSRRIQTAVLLTRWLVAPFLLGMVCCIGLIVYRFFADLIGLAVQTPKLAWHDLIVGVLNLVDLTLTASLVLIIIFAAYENYIQKPDPDDIKNWPDGVTNVDFGLLKQRLFGSISAIAAVDALSWYLDLDKYSDTSKLGWAIAFPLMFVVALLLLAAADWLSSRAKK